MANEVRMLRATHNGSFLLVEGSADKRFLSGFVDLSSCEVVICSGRENLLGAVSELGNEGFQGALGFADRDFSDITGYPGHQGVVVYTDENDLEMMLLCSGALDKILMEYGKSCIARTLAKAGNNIRNMIFKSARVIGTLRILSHEKSWSLRFDNMKYNFVDTGSCLLDVKKTVNHVMRRTGRSIGLSADAVESLVLERMSRNSSAKESCCGHDCVRVLGRALKKQIGSTRKFDNEKRCCKRWKNCLGWLMSRSNFRSHGSVLPHKALGGSLRIQDPSII